MTSNNIAKQIDLAIEINPTVQILKSDVSTLKSDVSTLKSDVSILKSDVSILKSDVSILKSDVSILKDNFSIMSNSVTKIEKYILDLQATNHEILSYIRSNQDIREQSERIQNHEVRICALENTIKKRPH